MVDDPPDSFSLGVSFFPRSAMSYACRAKVPAYECRYRQRHAESYPSIHLPTHTSIITEVSRYSQRQRSNRIKKATTHPSTPHLFHLPYLPILLPPQLLGAQLLTLLLTTLGLHQL